MDYLEQPEIKEKYEKYKYVVKLWEHTFKKSKGRQPSKLDIREADKEVKSAYKKYYQLKTTALEQSFQGVDGFNFDEESVQVEETLPIQENEEVLPQQETQENAVEEGPDINKQFDEGVWGAHLTIQSKPEEPEKEKSPKTTIKKLFKGAKMSKRNPRKSLSFVHKNKSQSESRSDFLSQPSDLSKVQADRQELSFEGLFPSIKVSTLNLPSTSQSTSIIDRVLNEKCKNMKSVDSGWLDRIDNANAFPASQPDFGATDMDLKYDSDDIVESSDEEELPAAKRQKLLIGSRSSITLPAFIKPVDSNVIQTKTILTESTDANKLPEDDEPGPESDMEIPIIAPIEISRPEEPTESVINARKSRRNTRTRVNMAESEDENQDPYHTDNDSSDPEFHIIKPDRKGVPEEMPEKPVEKPIKKAKKSRKKVDKVETAPEAETETPYELEYSIKPRISAPRYKNLNKLLKEQMSDNATVEVDPKMNKGLARLRKKIQSGTLNENFVTINLKKKIFCKGKKNMNFSKYKKQMWKNKKKALEGPDMSGCDGGVLTCFNCGDVGHFARQCPTAKGDTLLPVTVCEEEEECTIPTLEEAAKLAQASAWTVRKSTLPQSQEEEEGDSKHGDEVFDDGEDENLLAEALRLEDHVAKLDVTAYVDPAREVKPYYETDQNEPGEEVMEALKLFGHDSFRTGQEKAILRILCGKSTLLTLSTGSGKSLCYQLPAYLYSQRGPCITLVISPLVSLMEDQVTGIPSFLKAACLHTNQTQTQRDKITAAIKSGSLDVLLVSPEAVVAGERANGFGSLLRQLPPIAFACIDEAHCVSQWSHNFRPSYLMICRVLKERMGVRTILGLTATATRATCDSIIQHLDIVDGMEGVISDVPLPDNLILTVSKDVQKDNSLVELLSSYRFRNCDSIIVYCTRREECDRIARYLRTTLLLPPKSTTGTNNKRKRGCSQVETYHAGMVASRRRTVQKAFMCGELRIVVATVAFGMGINKPDIRAVIHYNMPKNFESYVQEVGRAGRDGLEAHCHLFVDSKGKDENELRRHIFANSIDRHVIRKLLELVFVPCNCKDYCPKHEVAFSIEQTVRALDIPEENISTLLCYLELHENNYIQLLCPAYTNCKLISYGGPKEIRKAAKDCPPLAMALALDKGKGEENILQFDVIGIASAIGWDSGICKHKLKNLEWSTVNGQSKRSSLSVRFTNLGFRMLSPGNLSSVQLDEALDNLYNHVVNQERTSLLQLRAVHQTMTRVAQKDYRACLDQEVKDAKQVPLKSAIRAYFESTNPLETVSLVENEALVDEQLLKADIQGLISTYRDNHFTGRAVARIFQGISSPNYPALIWGKCKYWRKHIDVDFHKICDLAKMEIINFR